MGNKLYYEEIYCPDYVYKHTDGYQGEIDKNFREANTYNRHHNEEKKKDNMKDVHMYTPFK